jgi:tetratricopeptide (TPR) repeat protein
LCRLLAYNSYHKPLSSPVANKIKTKKGDRQAHAIAVLHAAIIRHILAGRFLDAHLGCQQALAMDPENPETMNLIAVAHMEASQFDHAVEWASRAIRKDPKAQYLTTLGTALAKSGRLDEAIKVFDKAVGLAPGDAMLWWQMGDALIEAGRSQDALLCFQHTLALDPRNGHAACKAGYILHGLGRFEEALPFFDKSLELLGDHALTLQMRSLVLREMKRFEEALADSQRAIKLDPASADVCNNHGGALHALGRRDEALIWYERSLQIKPDQARPLANKAAVLTELHCFDEAEAMYERAIAADPNYAEAAWNLALLQMLRGNFEAGWSGREVRWRIPALVESYPKFSGPMWLGAESVASKTVIVCQDEGLGDVIQFARYVPLLASRGARVILVVEPSLCPLLSRLQGVSLCLPKLPGTALPPFDFHIPIDSLPLAFRTTRDNVPACESYLPSPDADRVRTWESRLGPHERLRVGLVWSGNPKHRNDQNRSISLQAMSRILDIDATFVSLQNNPRPQDADFLRERREVVDLSEHMTDFAETAALVSCLDLVLTVDTSVAHLAAALGRPTWILLPYTPDFRWLLHRDDNPWYPTMRLFRQSQTREYGSVLDRVRTELTALLSNPLEANSGRGL